MSSSLREIFSVVLTTGALFLLLGGCSSTVPQASAPIDLFREIGYEDAINLSKAEAKPLFLFFAGDGTKERQKRALHALAGPKIVPLLRERTISLRIEVADLPDIAKKYHVTRVPLLLLVAPDGHEINRWASIPKPEAFATELNTLLTGAPAKPSQHASIESADHVAQQQATPEQMTENE